jgi:hypothetical protein
VSINQSEEMSGVEVVLPEPVAEIVEKKSTYTDRHRQYYLDHKKEIYERDYAKGKYHRRYERKREELKAKALARYYRKKEEKLKLEQQANGTTIQAS